MNNTLPHNYRMTSECVYRVRLSEKRAYDELATQSGCNLSPKVSQAATPSNGRQQWTDGWMKDG